MMITAITIPQRRALVLADLLPGSLIRDTLLVIGAAGFVGLLAQISIHLSFTPVPITGQTMGVLVAGAALGWRRGALAMMLYGLAGVAGVPWFANHSSGYVGATFGYIVGFILCAALCGFLAEHGADRSLKKSAPAMLAGEVVLYTLGVGWLAVSLHVGLSTALALGLQPFVIGDLVKAVVAAMLLPGAWKLAQRD